MRDKATSKLPTPTSSSSTSSSGGSENGGQRSDGRLLTYTGTLSKTMVSIMHFCPLQRFICVNCHFNKNTIYTVHKHTRYLYAIHCI